MTTSKSSETAAKKDVAKLQRAIVDGLEDVKAQDIQVFNTEHLTALFERVIVASGTSNRQTKALAASVRDKVKDAGFGKPRTEGEDNGEWIIVDCGSVVAHIMQPMIRQYYRLEDLWGELPVRLKLGAAKPVAPDAKVPVKTAARRAAKAAAAEDAVPSKAAAKKAAAKKAAAKKTTARQPTFVPAEASVAARKAPAKTPVKTPAKTPAKAPLKTAAKPAAKKSAKAPASAPPVKTVVVKPRAAPVPAKKAAAKKAANKAANKAAAPAKSTAAKTPARKAPGRKA